VIAAARRAGSDYLRDCTGKGGRAEASIVTNTDTFVCILVSQNVIGDGGSRDADVGEGKVIGNDAAPSVRTKLDG
jgi:hypothetical protein